MGFYATPALIEGLKVYGALYNAELELDFSSLRNSQNATFKHCDPAYLFPADVHGALELSQDYLFLGHNFSQYGHFILETLPMLTPLLEDSSTHGFFLPWGSRDDLLFFVLDLLEIERSRVLVHRERRIVYSNFRIVNRPLIINKTLLAPSLYYPVIEELKRRVIYTISERTPAEKVFLDRKPDRVSTA